MGGRKSSVTKRTRNGVAPEAAQRVKIANNMSAQKYNTATEITENEDYYTVKTQKIVTLLSFN